MSELEGYGPNDQSDDDEDIDEVSSLPEGMLAETTSQLGMYLIHRRAGNATACRSQFEGLHRSLRPIIVQMAATHRSGRLNAEDGEDVVQDLFLALWSQQASWTKYIDSASAFIRAASSMLDVRARRKLIEGRRGGKRKIPYTSAPPDIDLSFIDKALRALSEQHRELITRVVVKEEHIKSIAEDVGTSVWTVYRQYSRAMDALRKILSQQPRP